MIIPVDLTEVKHCAKCDRVSTYDTPIFRHHMGCDGYLGHFNKRILGNYNKWLDCVHLCFECHYTIHFIYDQKYLNLWINRSARGAAHMRLKLIEVCKDWLAGRIPTPSVPKSYILAFKRNHAQWLKTHGESATG